MKFLRYWWDTFKKGYQGLAIKIGVEGILFGIAVTFIITLYLGNSILENVVLTLVISLLLFVVAGFLYSIFFQSFEENSSLKFRIEQIKSGILHLSVIPAFPKRIKKNDKNKRYASLVIISHEKQKIVDFRAEITTLLQRDSNTPDDSRGNSVGSEIFNFNITWEDEKRITEIYPGAQKEVSIAWIPNRDDKLIIVGDHFINLPNKETASIIEIEIQFIGRLEGDFDYSSYDFRGELLLIPDDTYPILEFIENREFVPSELQKKVYLLPKVE
jgi:hypothetical protein